MPEPISRPAHAPTERPTPVSWDADSYERLADAQFQWALEVVGWRSWRGDECVLDAGCGPGRVAQELLQRHRQLRLVAVDNDAGMLAKARSRLRAFGGATVLEADLARLPALPTMDVVLSTAVLHWVPDHDAAFAGFHRVMRPGGELLAQFGGVGNIATLVRVAGAMTRDNRFAHAFQGWVPPWQFEDAEATAQRLRRAGFKDVKASLQPKPTRFPGREAFLAFCETAPLRPYLGQLSPPLRTEFVAKVGDAWQMEGLPWVLDYVRLNVRARKPG